MRRENITKCERCRGRRGHQGNVSISDGTKPYRYLQSTGTIYDYVTTPPTKGEAASKARGGGLWRQRKVFGRRDWRDEGERGKKGGGGGKHKLMRERQVEVTSPLKFPMRIHKLRSRHPKRVVWRLSIKLVHVKWNSFRLKVVVVWDIGANRELPWDLWRHLSRVFIKKTVHFCYTLSNGK